ncbi:LPS export ABC transporter permease LptG [Flexibacterium corallicola]|uniref:LPS export ABC transporter permease LptG n=1 Tax=Flexibacterium corallicola TaxID=3037259 RepID=UPI00286F0399|nr:LPS export ABC transporter permease LptG [Pseudovibrio sp. M1P-2-3]
MGRTLSIYISSRFLKNILALFIFATLMIFLFDFLELVRKGADREGFSVLRVLAMSILRVPLLLEQVLPFAVLFGSIWAFLSLSRSLELVVARASGMSVWQFTAPAVLTGLFIGIFAVAVYNPIAAKMQEYSDKVAEGLFGVDQSYIIGNRGEVWLRQDGSDGESVLHARHFMDSGAQLNGVTVFAFDNAGEFLERIEANSAKLSDNIWHLNNVTVYALDTDPQHYQSYTLSTFLTPTEIKERIASPEAISFWELPRFIELSQRAGLPAYRYSLQYQTLLARPLLFVAMVLIAATVSLRVSRFGGVGTLIVSGIFCGFVLYVITEVSKDLGGAGIVPTTVAAWAPGVFGVLMGLSILLKQEDG